MPFKIFLVYHSHIDIGYTERQEKMAIYQADFIKQAVKAAISDKQAGRDARTKFRFTAEGFWAVEQYLKRYGESGKKELLEAIGSGCFELTSGYFHMAELLNYKNLSHSLDYAQDFAKENGLDTIDTAMACDINGFSWGYADALYDHGVRYLETNINTHHGDAPFSKPLVPFWWETPKGRKLLVWNGLTYHKANLLGLIPGLAPGGNPFIPGMLPENAPFVKVDGPDYAYKRISQMLKATIDSGYPYDFMPIMGSGLYTDNSPVGDAHCELIAQFNEKYGDEIEIVTSTLGEFFDYLEANGGEFPTYRGDWNDWWTDGALSTPNETKLFRNAQRVEELVTKLDPEMKVVSRDEHEAIQNLLITYAEHTWGHSSSHSDPYKLLVTQLDARKAKLAFDADVLACTALDKVSRALGEGEFKDRRPFCYHVTNPHDFDKDDIVYLPTDFWEDGNFYMGGFQVVDEDGQVLPSQKTQTLRGSMIACHITMKPHERKVLTLEFSPEIPGKNAFLFQRVEADAQFENSFYTLTYGKDGIRSIVHKATGEELLYADAPKLGEPVYQLFPGGVRAEAAGFGYTEKHKPAMEIHNASLQFVELVESGEVFTQLKVVYTIKGAVQCIAHYFLYNHLPKLMVTVEMAKDLVMDPEGMYVSLPLKVDGGEWHLDKAGAFFKPGEQLPEGCCDYYPINRGVVLSGDRLGLAVNSLDTPMLSIGRIKLWDYTRTADTSGPIYSWLTNNKWETNFRTQCAGYLESRYVIEIDPALTAAQKGLRTLESNEYDIVVGRE